MIIEGQRVWYAPPGAYERGVGRPSAEPVPARVVRLGGTRVTIELESAQAQRLTVRRESLLLDGERARRPKNRPRQQGEEW